MQIEKAIGKLASLDWTRIVCRDESGSGVHRYHIRRPRKIDQMAYLDAHKIYVAEPPLVEIGAFAPVCKGL
jgi:hypothetical protein